MRHQQLQPTYMKIVLYLVCSKNEYSGVSVTYYLWFEAVALLERGKMANITDLTQQKSSGLAFEQVATNPSIGLVVSVCSNIVLHTVLNELHEILKTILTSK